MLIKIKIKKFQSCKLSEMDFLGYPLLNQNIKLKIKKFKNLQVVRDELVDFLVVRSSLRSFSVARWHGLPGPAPPLGAGGGLHDV